MEANLAAARLTNSEVRFVGVAINSSAMAADAVDAYLASVEEELRLPTVDPFRHGVARIVDNLA